MDDESTKAAPPAIYQVANADTEARQKRRQRARADRADLLLELVSLVPGAEHSDALRIVLELETLDADTARDLRDSWLHTVQRAYVAGRVESANEAVELLTGEPQGPRAPGSRLTH